MNQLCLALVKAYQYSYSFDMHAVTANVAIVSKLESTNSVHVASYSYG